MQFEKKVGKKLDINNYFGDFISFKRKAEIVARTATNSNYWKDKAITLNECNKQMGVYDDGKIYGTFCRERICPMCQRRLSLKTYAQLQNVVNKLNVNNFLLLTLTVKNCNGNELGQTISTMNKAFSKLWRELLSTSCLGCFRALEVTYNSDRDDYHPHFHAILSVDDDYFSTNKYLHVENLITSWRTCWNHSGDGWADIRPIKDIENGVAEVAKYAVKPFDISDDKLTIKMLDTLYTALKGRRLTQTYGDIKTALKDCKSEYKALEHKTARDCKDWYYWNGNYYVSRETPPRPSRGAQSTE